MKKFKHRAVTLAVLALVSYTQATLDANGQSMIDILSAPPVWANFAEGSDKTVFVKT